MDKMSINRVRSGVFRRQIETDCNAMNFDPQYLAHLSRYDTAVRLMIDESARLERPISVVNIGCGDMIELRLFNTAYWNKKSDVLQRYVCVDIEEFDTPVGEAVSEAIGFEMVQLDLSVDAIPQDVIDDESVDLVISMEFIEHIGEEVGADVLNDMYAILKPGGLLYLATPNADNNKFEEKYHRYEYGFEEMLALLSDIGFDIVDVYGTLINRIKFSKIAEEVRQPIEKIYGYYWQKILLAAAHPELSDAVAYICRK